MKRIILFFAVCLGLSVSQTTFADDAETARIATKRSSTTVSTTQSSSRSTASSAKRPDNSQNAQKNTRSAVKTQQRVISRTPTTQQNVIPRSTTTFKIPENVSRTSTTTTRSNVSRTLDSRKTESQSSVKKSAMAQPTRSATRKQNSTSTVRAAELNTEKITNIKALDYSKCKTVYYECMDEFCANKDTNLRRCACSSRANEFDSKKKKISQAEDKMLDFNQRLLTVNLDKEDADAISVATEGELAYSTKDKSESEKLLQKITKTLNNSGDSKINNNLSAISLSLDLDSAWDNIDSLSGVATTSKSGIDLYNAASPVCIEMAKEVCTEDELDIAQNGYKLTIEQDCNTVSKSYNTLYNNALEKIHESSALLDISRLNNYQQRNSDDTLTCKKKILAQLSEPAVCGEKLYKCLDTTGQYIDPSTGEAFLSEELYNLTNLLREPNSDERWSGISQNENFVKFLNSKKEFLEPAMKQCEDISDTVWKEFLDDALAQIKLAQNAKMEEVRQSCTTLITECKTEALDSLSNFDARALSTFSVAADKTANEMCSSIQNSCIALMGNSRISNDWEQGITGIEKNNTRSTAIETCTNVGRDCFVQQCNGTSGNFALCMSTTSDIRIGILKHNACWDEVEKCVSNADKLTPGEISDIMKEIWGTCDEDPTQSTAATTTQNAIDIPSTGSTLLSWLATNTGTTTSEDSCNVTGCPIGYTKNINGECSKDINETTTDCGNATSYNQIVNIATNLTNLCASGIRDQWNNCCDSGAIDNNVCVPQGYSAVFVQEAKCNAQDSYYCPTTNPKRTIYLYCISDDTNPVQYHSDVDYYTCTGDFILIDQYGNYFYPAGVTANLKMEMTYKYACEETASCTYQHSSQWQWIGGSCSSDAIPTDAEFTISYEP